MWLQPMQMDSFAAIRSMLLHHIDCRLPRYDLSHPVLESYRKAVLLHLQGNWECNTVLQSRAASCATLRVSTSLPSTMVVS